MTDRDGEDRYSNLVPDFNFHAWPQVGINDYAQTVDAMGEAGRRPPMYAKVGWIGNVGTSDVRGRMVNIINDHPLFDVCDTGAWKKAADDQATERERLQTTKAPWVSLPDLVTRYAWLLDVEGHGYSGRLKYLLWSRRTVLLVDRPFHEFFFADLRRLGVCTIWSTGYVFRSRRGL